MIIETNNSGNIIVNNNEHELNSFNKTLVASYSREKRENKFRKTAIRDYISNLERNEE
jgi:hypothetical protein